MLSRQINARRYGLYELKVGNDRISLDVSSDQSFTETLDGHLGRWSSEQENVLEP